MAIENLLDAAIGHQAPQGNPLAHSLYPTPLDPWLISNLSGLACADFKNMKHVKCNKCICIYIYMFICTCK